MFTLCTQQTDFLVKVLKQLYSWYTRWTGRTAALTTEWISSVEYHMTLTQTGPHTKLYFEAEASFMCATLSVANKTHYLTFWEIKISLAASPGSRMPYLSSLSKWNVTGKWIKIFTLTSPNMHRETNKTKVNIFRKYFMNRNKTDKNMINAFRKCFMNKKIKVK